MTTPELVLGPMMRYVDQSSASIWVETRDNARVTVSAGAGQWEARTFAVHGHHYALVEVDGLEPGSVTPYTVAVNGVPVWPEPGTGFLPPVIATLKPGKPLRLAFGYCRTSVPHDGSGNRSRLTVRGGTASLARSQSSTGMDTNVGPHGCCIATS